MVNKHDGMLTKYRNGEISSTEYKKHVALKNGFDTYNDYFLYTLKKGDLILFPVIETF